MYKVKKLTAVMSLFYCGDWVHSSISIKKKILSVTLGGFKLLHPYHIVKIVAVLKCSLLMQ